MDLLVEHALQAGVVGLFGLVDAVDTRGSLGAGELGRRGHAKWGFVEGDCSTSVVDDRSAPDGSEATAKVGLRRTGGNRVKREFVGRRLGNAEEFVVAVGECRGGKAERRGRCGARECTA